MITIPAVDSAAIEARTIRKVRARVIPLVFMLFVIAVLDRNNIGFAALTMNKELFGSPANSPTLHRVNPQGGRGLSGSAIPTLITRLCERPLPRRHSCYPTLSNWPVSARQLADTRKGRFVTLQRRWACSKGAFQNHRSGHAGPAVCVAERRAVESQHQGCLGRLVYSSR
jgi:hypothetical protein